MNRKINYYTLLPLLFFTFFLETAFFPQVFSGSFVPNLLLVLIVAAGIVICSEDFIYLSFAVGLFADLYTATNFGIFSLSFLFLAMVICVLQKKILKEESLTRILLVAALAVIAYDIFYATVLYLIYYMGMAYLDYTFVGFKIIFDLTITLILIYPAKYLISKKN
jgi:rod shape-determining protein MreD